MDNLQNEPEEVLHGFGEDVQLFIEQDKFKDNTWAVIASSFFCGGGDTRIVDLSFL